MLQSNGLKGRISAKENITTKLNNKEVQVYPELEDLIITPSAEEQHFKSEKYYGYNEVTLRKVESEELSIIPSAEEQVKEGMFNKVTVAGDSDLIPENIKEGTDIFGVTGIAKTTSLKITDASYLFYNGARTDCLNEILELCNKVTNTEYMFYYCKSLIDLDVSNLDTSNVTNMKYMFYYCNKLTSLDISNLDTSNVTNMYYMFAYCENLTSLDFSSFDTSKVTSMSNMFNYCRSLTSLDLSSFDMSNVTNIQYMFNYCINLTNLKSFKNLGKGYTQKTNNYSNYTLILSPTYKTITPESLIDVIKNGLYDLNLSYDVANGGTLYRQSLVLGSANLEKLQTTEEGLEALAEADRKGWNVT